MAVASALLDLVCIKSLLHLMYPALSCFRLCMCTCSPLIPPIVAAVASVDCGEMIPPFRVVTRIAVKQDILFYLRSSL